MALALVGTLSLTGCEQVDETELMRRAEAHSEDRQYRAAVIELKKVLKANAGNAQARRALGEVYLRVEDGASAEKELTRALELGIPEAELMVPIGRALLLQGRYDEVISTVSLTRAADMGLAKEARLLHASALLGNGHIAAAQRLFKNVLESNPKSTEAMLGVGQCQQAEGYLDSAATWLDKGLRFAPEDPHLWLQMGTLRFEQRRFEDAEAAFDKAIGHAAAAQIVPKQIAAQLGRAQSLLAQGHFDRAQDDIDAVLARAKSLPGARYLNAVVAYNKKDYESAVSDLHEVLNMAPNHAPSLLLIGSSLYATGRLEQANEHLTRYVSLVPDNVRARKLLGAVRLRLGNPSDAMQALTPAIREESEDAQLLALVGQASAQSGQGELALRYLRKASAARPDDSGIRSGLAAAYIQKGQYEQAIRELESAAAPGDRRSQVLLVYAHLRNEDFDGARRAARAVVAAAPQEAAGALLAGSVELAAGDAEAAEAQFNGALALRSDFVPAMVALGRLNLQQQDLDAAQAWFEKARAQDEQNVDALIGLAQVSDARGKTEEALAGVEEARQASDTALSPRLLLGRYYLANGEIDKALEVLDEAEQARPGNSLVLSLLGQAQQRAGQTEQALETFTRLQARQPNSTGVLIRMADLQSQLGRHEQARGSLRQALAIDPDAVQARAALALVEARGGNLEKALALAQETQASHPDSALGYLVAGDIQMRREDYAAAERSYREAFARSASREILFKHVGARSEKGDNEGARALIEAWLADNPEDSGARLALASRYQEAGEVGKASELYEAVLEQEPDNVVALNNLAVLVGQRNKELAIRYAKRAVELAPDSGAVKDTFGWLLVESGRYEQGRRYLEEAVAALDHPTIRYHLAVAMVETGAAAQARRELRAALGSQRAFPERADAEGLLQRLEN